MTDSKPLSLTTDLETCDQCCGTGWMHPDNPAGKCSKCNGSGGIPRTTDPDYDAAERKALVELLIALPALPDGWSPGTVQEALHRALVAYEEEKSAVRARRRELCK